MVADDHSSALRLSLVPIFTIWFVGHKWKLPLKCENSIYRQSDSLGRPCCISRRVRDLTRRLEDHKIEYQHRYRRSRKSSTGCGGLRALNSKARTRSAFCIGKSVRYLYVWDCHGAGALLYADVWVGSWSATISCLGLSEVAQSKLGLAVRFRPSALLA